MPRDLHLVEGVLAFAPMSENKTIVEFIPADQIEKAKEDELERVYEDPEPYSETAEMLRPLSDLANSSDGVSRLRVPRDVKRQRVVQAFYDAFELIGGVPRLAHWGDQNPGEFFKLYARLLPNQAQQQLEHSGEVIIRHAIPRGALDE